MGLPASGGCCAARCARRVSFSRVSATTRRRSAAASSPSSSSADRTSASRLAISSSLGSSKSISAASGFGARGLRLDSRTRLAACFNSSLPPAARCSSSGRSATAAAALIEITPAFTASTTSGAAWAWMRSIMPTWLVLSLASRASSARLIFGAGSHGGLSSPSSTTSAVPSLSRCACSTCLRAARMSRLRSASTPRWKSDTLRRPRCCSIIHRCTSSMLWKRVFCTVLKGRPCFWQMPKRLWPSTSTLPHSTSASRQPSARMLRSSASCSSAVSGSM